MVLDTASPTIRPTSWCGWFSETITRGSSFAFMLLLLLHIYRWKNGFYRLTDRWISWTISFGRLVILGLAWGTVLDPVLTGWLPVLAGGSIRIVIFGVIFAVTLIVALIPSRDVAVGSVSALRVWFSVRFWVTSEKFIWLDWGWVPGALWPEPPLIAPKLRKINFWFK